MYDLHLHFVVRPTNAGSPKTMPILARRSENGDSGTHLTGSHMLGGDVSRFVGISDNTRLHGFIVDL